MTNNLYLSRYGHPTRYIDTLPAEDVEIIVCLPCFKEPDLIPALQSLAECTAPGFSVEVIICLNRSEIAEQEVIDCNQRSVEQFQKFVATALPNWLRFHLIEPEPLPKKHAGVGLARKIAMDEAVHRFEYWNKDGILACFDADSTCSKNYFVALKQHFDLHPKSPACTIHFEHPLQGPEPDDVYNGIIDYELFLRYYVNALRFCAYPAAHQAIGSSMAAKSKAYQKQGGMNKRKAGEDFYFINKMILLGHYSELKNTCIYPSPRVSDRVPFGTGRAIGTWLENKTLDTYHFQIFRDLKSFIQIVPNLYKCDAATKWIEKMPRSIQKFFLQDGILEKVEEINKNTKSPETFLASFYRYLDCFKVLKFVHYCKDNAYPNVEILSATSTLLEEHFHFVKKLSKKEALELLRSQDKSNSSDKL